MPWSVLRGERAPTERWSSRDARLAVALTQLEAALCSGCGQPQWLAFDPDLAWEVDDDPWRCHPCTAREHAVKAWTQPDDGDDTPVDAPGALRWTVRQHHPDKHDDD